MARRAKEKSRISDELLDELLAGEDPAEAFRNGGLLSEMKKAVAERALNAEMDHHLSREPERESGNHRNGHNRKRVATESGSMDLAVPRDRHATRRWQSECLIALDSHRSAVLCLQTASRSHMLAPGWLVFKESGSK